MGPASGSRTTTPQCPPLRMRTSIRPRAGIEAGERGGTLGSELLQGRAEDVGALAQHVVATRGERDVLVGVHHDPADVVDDHPLAGTVDPEEPPRKPEDPGPQVRLDVVAVVLVKGQAGPGVPVGRRVPDVVDGAEGPPLPIEEGPAFDPVAVGEPVGERAAIDPPREPELGVVRLWGRRERLVGPEGRSAYPHGSRGEHKDTDAPTHDQPLRFGRATARRAVRGGIMPEAMGPRLRSLDGLWAPGPGRKAALRSSRSSPATSASPSAPRCGCTGSARRWPGTGGAGGPSR